MNERIKQLAKQAGGYISLSYEHENKLILSGTDTIEQFAELIVKECVTHLYDMNGPEFAESLKEHFGVEE